MPYFYCFKQLHETNILKKSFSFPPVVRNATSFFSIEKRLFFLNNVGKFLFYCDLSVKIELLKTNHNVMREV
jgi:hypothetical protein